METVSPLFVVVVVFMESIIFFCRFYFPVDLACLVVYVSGSDLFVLSLCAKQKFSPLASRIFHLIFPHLFLVYFIDGWPGDSQSRLPDTPLVAKDGP